MSEQSLLWAGFGLLMVIMLAIDLGMNRTAHEVSFRQALTWSIGLDFAGAGIQCRHLCVSWSNQGAGIFDRLYY